MSLSPNFYRDRVCLNVLAGSKKNAVEIFDAAEGHKCAFEGFICLQAYNLLKIFIGFVDIAGAVRSE